MNAATKSDETQRVTFRDAARATLAARLRTQCYFIGQRAVFGGGVDAVLVIYRKSGTSIVVPMREKLTLLAYCDFIRAMTREDMAARLRAEAVEFRAKATKPMAERTRGRLVADAAFLDECAQKLDDPTIRIIVR